MLKKSAIICTIVSNGIVVQEGGITMQQSDINKIKYSINHHLGTRVRVKSALGRKKYEIDNGIIKNAYSNIFTIETEEREDMPSRLLTFSYTDVLTNDVMMILDK